MKELSIEEKARRYDEAIKRVEDIVGGKCSKPFVFTEGLFDYIFPKLKESEDERIMKTLYKMAKVPRKEIYEAEGITKEQALAWLEKQSKQKETLCDKCKKTQPSHSCQDITALGRCALEKQGEYKPAFNIDIPFGAKDSELMEASYYIPEGFHAEIEGNHVVIKKDKQKLAWSEEDESILNEAIYFIRREPYRECDVEPIVDWLKLLKDRVLPQNTWKPSDEQIKAVKEAACYSSVFSEKTIDNLIYLSKDLKKLKG